MTDLLASDTRVTTARVDTSSEAARARVRARYRSEMRFRTYGQVAIIVTALFLAVLVIDIVRKGLPAFWQHSLVLDVAVTAEDIDPSGKRDPAELRSGDFFAPVRRAVEAQFPGVEGRAELKKIGQLISVGADDELRRLVLADPKLIGQTVRMPVLLDDNADLYLKGEGTRIETRGGRGIATPTATTGEVRILSASNDFAGEVTRLKAALTERATALRVEAGRLERANVPETKQKGIQAREEAAALQARIDGLSNVEALDDRMPSTLIAINGGLVKIEKLGPAEAVGQVILPLSSTADARAGDWKVVTYLTPESNRKATDLDVALLEHLRAKGKIENGFNWRFLTAGDSREPELAGIRGSLMGTVLTLFITLLLCLPIGVMAAVYLEEFAPKNRLTDLIEVNINNLAAVPSIVFGLLGLAVFLNFFNLPRSAPLVGGLVLALLVLPTIIIASRAALKAVPPSIKEAALGVGASHQQAVFHHVLPLAMPGIMTGTIIGMAHALGETAPLLMIGMIAFIVDIPTSLTEAATVLPVQIYLWSDLPEPAFKAKTAGAIIILLLVLFAMNGLAIWLRKKFERRW
jgi:phosphate transport system permease protein